MSKFPLTEGQIGQETSTERFLVRNQCRRWPRRPCGQLGVFIFNDDVGKTSFPGAVFQRGVSERCFREVFQRGVSEGCSEAFQRVFQTPGWPSGAIVLRGTFSKVSFSRRTNQPKWPAQRDSASGTSAEVGLGVPVRNSACSFSTTMLGKHSFRGGVSQGCFMGCSTGVIHRGDS